MNFMVSLNPENEPEETMFHLSSRAPTPLEKLRKFGKRVSPVRLVSTRSPLSGAHHLPSPPSPDKEIAVRVIKFPGQDEQAIVTGSNVTSSKLPHQTLAPAKGQKLNIAQKFTKSSQGNLLIPKLPTKSAVSFHAQLPSGVNVCTLELSSHCGIWV